MTLQDESYKLHRLEEAPPKEAEVTREEMLHYYREMQVIREMENMAAVLYREKKIRGFLHLYDGQVVPCINNCSGTPLKGHIAIYVPNTHVSIS